jgi:hypothetical protein
VTGDLHSNRIGKIRFAIESRFRAKKQVTFCKGLDFRASLWNTLGINQTIENKGYAIFKTRR